LKYFNLSGKQITGSRACQSAKTPSLENNSEK
jgi:hypothetical protein